MALVVDLRPAGPILLIGPFILKSGTSAVNLPIGRSLSVCRCGASRHEYMCDGSHANVDALPVVKKLDRYDISGVVFDNVVQPPSVSVVAGGPLHLIGSIKVISGGREVWCGNQIKICRCGKTSLAGFCDGSHKKL